MRGILRFGKRAATIKVRVTSKNAPTGARVQVTDVMLQPGATVSGWLPHVTELPWSPGQVPGEGQGEMNQRIDQLENLVTVQQSYLNRIMSPAQVWRADNTGYNSLIETKWDADYGWISWLDVSKFPGTGDVGFWFPPSGATATAARPFAWSMDILTEGVSGVGSLRPRVDYMNGTTSTGSNAEISLTAWPDWGYRVEHDFILPASRLARPAFILVGKTSAAAGRIGLTRPRLAAKSERSQ